jgi:hypothetical protein
MKNRKFDSSRWREGLSRCLVAGRLHLEVQITIAQDGELFSSEDTTIGVDVLAWSCVVCGSDLLL